MTMQNDDYALSFYFFFLSCFFLQVFSHVILVEPPSPIRNDFLDNVRTGGLCGAVPRQQRNAPVDVNSLLNPDIFPATEMSGPDDIPVSWRLAYPHAGRAVVSMLSCNPAATFAETTASTATCSVTELVTVQGSTSQSTTVPFADAAAACQSGQSCFILLQRYAAEFGSTYHFRSCAPVCFGASCGGSNTSDERVECTVDADCGQGRCVDTVPTTVPVQTPNFHRTCYCPAGWTGDKCESNSLDTAVFEDSYFAKTWRVGGAFVGWTVDRTAGWIDVGVRAPTQSWVAVGWRPSRYGQDPAGTAAVVPSASALQQCGTDGRPDPIALASAEPRCPLVGKGDATNCHAMNEQDIVIGMAKTSPEPLHRVLDCYTPSRSTPVPDVHLGGQDSLFDSMAEEVDGTTFVRFRRRLSTPDCFDHQPSTNSDLIVAWGETQPELVPAVPDYGPNFFLNDVVKYHGGVNRFYNPNVDMLTGADPNESNMDGDDGGGTCTASPLLTCMQGIDATLTLHWTVLPNDEGVSFVAVFALATSQYVAFGPSPLGGMVGSDVVLGNQALGVNAYQLLKKDGSDPSGSASVDPAQTLTGTGYQQEGGQTRLSFTRPLDNGGRAIISTGSAPQSFVYAVGPMDGTLGYHASRSAFELSLGTANDRPSTPPSPTQQQPPVNQPMSPAASADSPAAPSTQEPAPLYTGVSDQALTTVLVVFAGVSLITLIVVGVLCIVKRPVTPVDDLLTDDDDTNTQPMVSMYAAGGAPRPSRGTSRGSSGRGVQRDGSSRRSQQHLSRKRSHQQAQYQ